MEWYNVLSIILGALGGTAGFIGIYKAKPEKTGIEIKNMQEMLDEAHKMYNAVLKDKDKINEEFRTYKEDTMRYIAEFKSRFAKLEERLDRTDAQVFHLTGAIYQGYRCKYPPVPQDCPVIKAFENNGCNECLTSREDVLNEE